MNLFLRVKQRQLGSRVSVSDLCGLMTTQTLAGEIDGSQYRKALALIDGFIVAGLLKVQPAEVRREQSRCQYQSRDKIDGVWTDWMTRTLAMGCLPDFDDVWTRPLMVDIPDPAGPTVDAEDVAAMLAAWRSEILADVNLGPLLALWLAQHGHGKDAAIGEVVESAAFSPEVYPRKVWEHRYEFRTTDGRRFGVDLKHLEIEKVDRGMYAREAVEAALRVKFGSGDLVRKGEGLPRASDIFPGVAGH